MKSLLGIVAILGALASPGFANPLLGVWKTEPDGKSQTGYVQMASCGGAVCGTIVSAYDKSGNRITTPNVGRQIIRDLRPVSANAFGGGKIYVPIMRAEFPLEITVSGDKLTLKACNSLGICRNQYWDRVQ